MLVSIIVITYNSELYVKETLESILKQTYQNLEIILSDDCSTDSTPDILKTFEEKYKNKFKGGVYYTQTEKNSGIVGNYNHALKFAKGEWIKYIAGDDRLKPNCIERFVANIHEGDYFLCCGRENFTNEGNEKWVVFEEHLFTKNNKDQIKKMIKKDPWKSCCGAVIFLHKEKLLEMNGFDEKYTLIEDYPLIMNYLYHGYYVRPIKEALIEYRVHQSVSNSGNPIFLQQHSDVVFYWYPKLALKGKMYTHWLNTKITYYVNHYSNRNIYYKAFGYFLRAFDIKNYQTKIKSFLE